MTTNVCVPENTEFPLFSRYICDENYIIRNRYSDSFCTSPVHMNYDHIQDMAIGSQYNFEMMSSISNMVIISSSVKIPKSVCGGYGKSFLLMHHQR